MAFVSMVLTANAAIKRGQSDACISSAERLRERQRVGASAGMGEQSSGMREQVRPEVNAQVNAADSVMQHARGSRLSVGGYGEVAYSRNFFSDHVSRYSQPEEHKNDPSHGRFDIAFPFGQRPSVPHAVIYMGYNFGKGWSLGTEIEFEHGGAGLSYEKEDEEGGEWEQETEKGGEVELEQFWIQKTFSRSANLRFGHIVVPVGLNNAHHEPLNFFTVYRPEGENTIHCFSLRPATVGSQHLAPDGHFVLWSLRTIPLRGAVAGRIKCRQLHQYELD